MEQCRGLKKTKQATYSKYYHYDINKTITLSGSDTINSMVFKIIDTGDSGINVIVENYYKLIDEVVICDAYQQLIIEKEENAVSVIDYEDIIWENNNFSSYHNASLNSFAGKGKKYIGYREVCYPSGENLFYYGWIKIELSADKKELKIIDRTIRYNNSYPIYAGLEE